MRKQIVLVALIALPCLLFGQSRAFGVKGGLGIATQRWNNFDRDVLIAPTGSVFMEFQTEGKFALFVEGGYHQRGSALRFRAQTINVNGTLVDIDARVFEQSFHNAALILGGKSLINTSGKINPYYAFGARLEYTFKNDLGTLYPAWEQYMNAFNYGVTLAGGLEYPFGKDKPGALFIEFSAHPDFSKQIFVPPGSYYNRWLDQNVATQEQKVINLSFEITLGIKFVQKIEYIDDDEY